MKAIFVVGLPGSGKTHFIRKYAKNYHILDDIGTLTPMEEVQQALIDGIDVVLVDSNFCRSYVLDSAVKVIKDFGYEVEFIFFENNYTQCLRNIEGRDERDVLPDLVELAKVYRPKDFISVYQKL